MSTHSLYIQVIKVAKGIKKKKNYFVSSTLEFLSMVNPGVFINLFPGNDIYNKTCTGTAKTLKQCIKLLVLIIKIE